MDAKITNHQLGSELTLYTLSRLPLTVHALALSLTKQDNEVIDYSLTFQVTSELYHRIDSEALFNLKPEVRTPLTNGDFQPSPDIQIEARLKPDLLPFLLEKATNAEEVATYLVNLSQKQPELTSKHYNPTHFPDNGQLLYRR
jgi:hypothetical protein